MDWIVTLIVVGGFAVYFTNRIRKVESTLDRHLDDTSSHCSSPRNEVPRRFNEARKDE